jgi:hypothetical protein
MSETNKDDDANKAVAKLKFFKFREKPERSFFLYKGQNLVGRDPLRSDVWLEEDFICREHLYIRKETGTTPSTKDMPSERKPVVKNNNF